MGRASVVAHLAVGVGHDCSSIYVAALSTGAIKVGFSDNPRQRLFTLAACARRRFGAALTEFHVFPGAGNRADEARCIAALGKVAPALPGTIEYFTGLHFDDAKALVSRALQDA